MDVPGQQLFNALYALEVSTYQMYMVTIRMIGAGARGPQVDAAIGACNRASTSLYAIEKAAYDAIAGAISRLPGSETLLAQVPHPIRFPPINLTPQEAYRYSHQPATATAGLSGGLGLAPLIVAGVAIPFWALAVLSITVVAAIAVALYFGSELLTQITGQINDTVRYYQQTLSFERSFQKCIASGQGAEVCNQAARPPAPPQAAPGRKPGSWPWYVTSLVVVGGVALALGLVYVVIRAKNPYGLPAGSYNPVRWSLPRGTRGLKGAGRDDYMLEVA